MNLLQEYEFESLPYVDNEYDHPLVSDLVHSMIASEMKSFVPDERNYLAHLPYPSIKFSNSSALQQEFVRIVKSGAKSSSDRLDSKRYSVDPPPDGPLQKDIQAWRKSVANAKAQYEHQSTRMMNVEVTSEVINDQWLSYNRNLEHTNNHLQSHIESKKRKIAEINTIRRLAQEKVATELTRSIKRRDNAITNQGKIIEVCSKMLSSYPMETQRQMLASTVESTEEEDSNSMDIES